MTNPFFKNYGPLNLKDIYKVLGIKKDNYNKKIKIFNVADLTSASSKDISFFHSNKYKSQAITTKAAVCITTKNLQYDLPDRCEKIVVENVLISTAKITEILYPDAVNDDFDNSVKEISKTKFKKKVKFGKNVLIGANVKIGKNCLIGHNTIIEKNVSIGDNCSIGSNTVIRNTILKNHVKILDGCIVGKKGFGFFPKKGNNYRFPQIGIVLIDDYSEIGCGSTIDRGSISNTVIGKNTYLDNQIHIAHNVKIGDNCIIAGQVGFAGSSVLGDNVTIGGQAGISGHLKIGNNIKIGGGSGVIKDIQDNSRVMGYPAKDLKEFIKGNK